MKTVVAYFNSVFNAQRAMGLLKKAGYDMVNIDIMDFESDLWGSISQLVLKSSLSNRYDVGTITDSDPMEDLSSGIYGELSDSNIKLVVTFDDEDDSSVKRIIKENGGII